MAAIKIVPDSESYDFMIVKDVNADDETGDSEPWWVATCTCGTSGSDRGNFEDTTQWALVHVEGAHE
jgi:hypothetical protein